MVLTLFSRKDNRRSGGAKQSKPLTSNNYTETDYDPAEEPAFKEDPLQRQLQLERYGFVIRQKNRWSDHPHIDSIYEDVSKTIDERFALVPEGFVSLAQTLNDDPGCPEVDMETGPFLLSRHCVTNQQYQLFVDDGGYEDLELWPKDVWPHLIDFKDQTGTSGPRYWQNGRHDKRLADHPVVGICYYEASAYARWAGYRLPTEAEWQMASSWCIRSSSYVLRRYPWGDALDKNRCNIWVSGIGRTSPVYEHASGAAPNGVLQLIGNVWEWTSSNFETVDDEDRPVIGDMVMKSVRGGAFDTYFPAQATSYFRTGIVSMARCNNIGIRCVFDIDIVPR
ncbi:MAG: formylglycine-generating enzyme family protein [Planctomycetota bacterium]|jgi:iron(II)-dependent oxidoreductase